MIHQSILVLDCLAAGTFNPATLSSYVSVDGRVTLVLLESLISFEASTAGAGNLALRGRACRCDM
jgi:hypothetical protein